MITRLILVSSLILMVQAYLLMNLFPAIISFLLLIYLLYSSIEFNPKILASRKIPEKLYDGEKAKAILEIRNLSKKDCIVKVREKLPEGFKAENAEFLLKGLEEKKVEYWIIPSRGVYRIKGPEICVEDIRGLFCRRFSVDSVHEVEVLPSIERLREEARTNAQITIRSGKSLYGIPAEFEGLRKFQEGDDFRRIDWKATARLGELIVREFIREWEGDVYIALDTSREMRKGKPSKIDYAITIIYQILTALKEKRAGLILYDEFGVRKILKATEEKERIIREIKVPRVHGIQSLRFPKIRIEKSIFRRIRLGLSLSLISAIPSKSFVIFITDLSTNVGELITAIQKLRDAKALIISPNPILFSELKPEREEILKLYRKYVEREEMIRKMNRIVPTIDVGPRDLLSEMGALL